MEGLRDNLVGAREENHREDRIGLIGFSYRGGAALAAVSDGASRTCQCLGSPRPLKDLSRFAAAAMRREKVAG